MIRSKDQDEYEMMDITIFSQNLRSKYKYFAKEFEVLLNQNELAIILIQDMGNVGPDGPQELRQALTPHTIITNTTPLTRLEAQGSSSTRTGKL